MELGAYFAALRPTLRQGSTGPAVAELQRKLVAVGLVLPSINGVYDNNTYTAVKTYQKLRGLVADGIAGPNTWAALDSNAPIANASYGPTISSSRPTVSTKAPAIQSEGGEMVGPPASAAGGIRWPSWVPAFVQDHYGKLAVGGLGLIFLVSMSGSKPKAAAAPAMAGYRRRRRRR